MHVERNNNETTIRLSAHTNLTGLYRILDFLRFKEITSKSKAAQEEIDQLAKESKSSWWKNNRKFFLGEGGL